MLKRTFSTSKSPILDPILQRPVLQTVVNGRLILDPISPFLNDRKRFAQISRETLQGNEENVIVPRHPTLENEYTQKRKGNLSMIRNVIAVSSGKGGVGKSTVAVNFAATLSMLGARVGIFDADIHGPSLPTMLIKDDGGTWEVKRINKNIVPLDLHGMKCMSYGFVSPGTGGKGERNIGQVLLSTKGPQASIMRGPVASKTAEELLLNTEWGELDFLVLDFPPGTGDLHLTMCQQLNIDSAIVVTTPQELSFVDVARGIDMLEALKVPVVAIVENMSWFQCDHGKMHFPFGTRGKGNLFRLKTAYGVNLGFSLPIIPTFSEAGDGGTPFVLLKEGQDETKNVYRKLAEGVAYETLKMSALNGTSLLKPKVTYDKQQNLIVIRIFDENSAKQYKIPPLEIRKRLSQVDEMMGIKKIDANIVPKEITPKGNYAVSITWSDGHSMSIYPYENLIQAAEDFEKERK